MALVSQNSYLYRGNIEFNSGNYLGAIIHYERALRIGEENEEGCIDWNIGNAYFQYIIKTKNYSLIEQCLTSLRKADMLNNSRASYILGNIYNPEMSYFPEKQFKNALLSKDYYIKVLKYSEKKQAPNGNSALNNLGNLYGNIFRNYVCAVACLYLATQQNNAESIHFNNLKICCEYISSDALSEIKNNIHSFSDLLRFMNNNQIKNDKKNDYTNQGHIYI